MSHYCVAVVASAATAATTAVVAVLVQGQLSGIDTKNKLCVKQFFVFIYLQVVPG